MLDWSPVVSPATILAIVAAFVGFGGWLVSMGARNSELKAQAAKVEDLSARLATFKQKREDEREADRKEQDMFRIAVNAGLTTCQTNLSEYKQEAAHSFATKEEVIALEARTNKGMDRIVDRLEQISSRLEAIGDMIVKSLSEHRS